MDRAQVIADTLLNPRQVALTKDALWFVSEWLRYYVTEEIDPLLMEYRSELMKALP